MEYIVTEQGKIRRRFRDGYQEYLGIPFAKPPVGDLRWKRPEKPEPYEAVLSADHFPNRCMQSPQQGFYLKEFYEDAQFMPPISEDCLYLNIWTPEDAEPGKNYPVALWIHGGAFMGGFASEMEFDGEAFAKKGVILVSIQYRLGIFGFFAHRELEQENKEHISGNYGIFDQIAAISWGHERSDTLLFTADRGHVYKGDPSERRKLRKWSAYGQDHGRGGDFRERNHGVSGDYFYRRNEKDPGR